MSGYLLDNDATQTKGRFDALGLTYDDASGRALATTGIGPGWRCWEVGGGGGGIAAWLADRTGPASRCDGTTWCATTFRTESST